MTRVRTVPRVGWFRRISGAALLVAFAAGGAVAGPGRADAYGGGPLVVRLRSTAVTAAGFGASDCGDFPPGSPGAGRDGWVFQAPAGGGQFQFLRLEFTASGDLPTVIDLSAVGDGASSWGSRLFNNGTQWWLSTPSGWTLRQGTATVSGATGDGFDVIRTCWGQQPVAAPERAAAADAAPAGGGSAVQQLRVVIAPTASATQSPTPPPGGAPPGHVPRPSQAGGRLPTTGGPVALLALAAAGLIALGAALRLAGRRRS